MAGIVLLRRTRRQGQETPAGGARRARSRKRAAHGAARSITGRSLPKCASDSEREHRALGVPFPALKERFERLEETLQIAHQMWSDNDGPFDGGHYQLAETICVPQPVQQPHPPIVIGGSGERKTLRLVAQYADACNLIAPDADTVEHKLQVLAGHCEDVGRDYADIEKTAQGAGIDPLADTDAFLRNVEKLARLGIEHVQLRAPAPDPVGYIARFGEEVAPRLAAIG